MLTVWDGQPGHANCKPGRRMSECCISWWCGIRLGCEPQEPVPVSSGP
jgi:hypothetical protein